MDQEKSLLTRGRKTVFVCDWEKNVRLREVSAYWYIGSGTVVSEVRQYTLPQCEFIKHPSVSLLPRIHQQVRQETSVPVVPVPVPTQ